MSLPTGDGRSRAKNAVVEGWYAAPSRGTQSRRQPMGKRLRELPQNLFKKVLTIRPGYGIIKSEKTKEEPKMTDLGFEWDITAEEIYGAMAGEEEGEEF